MALFYTDSRLDIEAIKHVHAMSGVDCIMQCLLQDESCRSANFKKNQISEEENNCELLNTVNSEGWDERLKKDENFDYYILAEPDRISLISMVSMVAKNI